jgi:transcriptional regulator with XRE-family HTH domain
MELTVKSEFHDLIPSISSEEYQLLEENLLNEGCREALVTWNDCILDGHNRYQICQKHNIGFKILEKEFNTEDEAKVWIIYNQVARRNLPAYERARLLLVLKPLIMEKAKQKQHESGGPVPQKSAKPPIDTREEIAKAAGVSHDTISKIETIEKKASPEVKEAARKGEMSVDKAYKTIIKKPNKQRKRKLGKPKSSMQFRVLRELQKWWQEATAETKSKFITWTKEKEKTDE